MVKAGAVTPKGKQNVQGVQKKGLKKKAGMENSGPVNTGVKGSGKRKQMEVVVKEEAGMKNSGPVKPEVKGSGKRKQMEVVMKEEPGIKKIKTENNTGKNPKQKQDVLKDITSEAQKPGGGKRKRNRKRGKGGKGQNTEEATTENGKVTVKEECEANGILSPAIKTGGKKAKKTAPEKNKMNGQVKSEVNGQVKSEVNGTASPKVGAKKGNKNKKPEMDNAQKGEKGNKRAPQENKGLEALPYKEDERMTMYDNSWIKKEAVEKLDELKTSLKEQGLGDEEIAKKVKKAKTKCHLQLKRELMRERNQGQNKSPKVTFIYEDGKRYKVLGNGRVLLWEKLQYEENERMTMYDNVWVKKEDVAKLDELKASLEGQGLEQKQITMQMSKAKNKARRHLDKAMRDEVKENEQKNKEGDQMYANGGIYLTDAEGKRVKVFRDGRRKTLLDLPFEENEHMTRYNGLWVKREAASKLDKKKESLQNDGLSEKQIKMKIRKEAAKAHKRLKSELVREGKDLVKKPSQDEVANKPSPTKKMKRNKKQKGGAGEEEASEQNTSKQEVANKQEVADEQEVTGKEAKKKKKKAKKGKTAGGKQSTGN